MNKMVRKFTDKLRAIKPEYVFLVLASVFGVILTFRMVPLFGNDEVVHFPRAYQVQEGRLWATKIGENDSGGYLPVQIKQFNDAYREQVQNDNTDGDKIYAAKQRYGHERLTDSRREPVVFTSATLSAGWDYLPPATGIFIARTLHLPLNWFVYVARLATLATYILLTFFAIKFIPIGKRFLLVVALLPTALTQGGTIGMDGLVNGLSWLIIALIFACLVKKLTATPKLLALLAFLSVYLATTKQGYLPIAALPLLLPARLLPFNLKRVWLWRVVFGMGLLIISLWYLQNTAHTAEVIHFAQRPGLQVDEGLQLHYIFQKPLLFLSMIFIQPFTIWSANIYLGIVGIVTNKLTKLPIPIILLLYISLLITLLHRERAHVSGRDRLYVLVSSVGIFLSTFTLINLALYLSFTRVGYDHVEGLQGRYFLPLLPLLGIILHTAMPKLFLKLSDAMTDIMVYPIILLGLLISATIIH